MFIFTICMACIISAMKCYNVLVSLFFCLSHPVFLWFYSLLWFVLVSGRPQASQPPASKGSYSQVGYSYKGDGNEEPEDLNSDDDDEEEEDDDDDKDFSSDDSNDERMESIAKEFGVKRYNWLVYMDKKAKEEEKRQKEIIKGDPSTVSTLISYSIIYLLASSMYWYDKVIQKKLSRRERRKASQIEREKEREAARSVGRVSYRDPYR